VLGDDLTVGPTKHVPQNERGDDRIIERASNGDELRDKVNRGDDPSECKPKPRFARPRDARIAEESSEQQNEVGKEGRQLPCVGASSESDKGNERQQPQRQRDADGDKETAEHGLKLTASSFDGVTDRIAADV
jgi:hypothetical protein